MVEGGLDFDTKRTEFQPATKLEELRLVDGYPGRNPGDPPVSYYKAFIGRGERPTKTAYILTRD